MALTFHYQQGQTPLDEEELLGLKVSSISTRAELDEFEQLNIQKAVEWSIGKKWNAKKILTEKFIMDLHKRMYGEIWEWAGTFRKTDKNIGVRYYLIPGELRKLLDDTIYWLEHHSYPSNEIAVRFKHRIVAIHCFANGNGRHSRLIADIIISHIFAEPVYSWGSSFLVKADKLRQSYIEALRQADRGSITALIEFARC